MIKATADNVEIYNDDGLKVFDLVEFREEFNKKAKQRQGIKDKTFIEIPDNATNGDIFQATCLCDSYCYQSEYVYCLKEGEVITHFDLEWWDAPYKIGENNE